MSCFQLTGNLTVGTVLTMLPYANAVSIFTVKGSALIAAIKNGLSSYPSGGRFLQVHNSQSVLLHGHNMSAQGSQACMPAAHFSHCSCLHLCLPGTQTLLFYPCAQCFHPCDPTAT
jgi:hypothetical protein